MTTNWTNCIFFSLEVPLETYLGDKNQKWKRYAEEALGDSGADSGPRLSGLLLLTGGGWEGFEPSSILWFYLGRLSIRMHPAQALDVCLLHFHLGLSEEVSFMRPPQCIPYVPPARANKKLTWPGLDMRSWGEPMVMPQVIRIRTQLCEGIRLLTSNL